MKNKKGILIILLVFALLIGGAYGLYNYLGKDAAPDQLAVQAPPKGETEPASQEENAPKEDSAEETDPGKVLAPDFTVYDADGNEVHLTDFVGKPVVLNFWASWCGPCKMEMPHFEELYLEQGADIQFLMVNMTNGQETVDSALALIQEEGYTFPVFYDTQMDAAMTYGVYSIPTTYFIDAQGHAIAQATGAIDKDTLQRGIDMIK